MRTRPTLRSSLSRLPLALFLASLAGLSACGGGGSTGGGPAGGNTPQGCPIPARLTVWNYSQRTIAFTHVFLNGDTTNFVTVGPGGLLPGEWRTVELSVIVGSTVALDVHFADGSIAPAGGFSRVVLCAEGVDFTVN